MDPADRFADSMRIVRHGTAPLLDQDLERDPDLRGVDAADPAGRDQ